MENANKVTVKIFGQEYTISGDKPREYIIKVADHVDSVMRDTSGMLPQSSTTSVAVLAAVNIASELFSEEEGKDEIKSDNEQLKRDIDHYIQMWEEAKKNFLQYKEDAQTLIADKEELQRKVDQYEMQKMSESSVISEKDERIEALERKNESLTSRLREQQAGESSNFEQIRDLEGKYKELEGNFFDLQMENIQLKGEIDRYKKIVE